MRPASRASAWPRANSASAVDAISAHRPRFLQRLGGAIGAMLRFGTGLATNWMGKDSLFRWPFGWIFRALGGTPVRRYKSRNSIAQMAALFEQSDELILALAPEGTRSPVTRWKSGFYHIALKAKVDIVPVGLDFKHKTIVIAPTLTPTGEIESEMNLLMDFFRGITGKHPKVIPQYVSRPK